MPASTPHRPLVTLLRGSTRLAALVLALFLAGILGNVACADHDLADAGIGQHQSHMPAPDGTPSGNSGSTAHAGGHCCHSGGTHSPALSTLVDFAPFTGTDAMGASDDPTRPSAPVQRELRPPIL